MMKKVAALTIAAGGAFVAMNQWIYIIYKIVMFYRDYKGVPYANHVGDDVLIMAYIIDAFIITAGIISYILIKSESIKYRIIALVPLLMNLAGCITFMLMQHYAILVGYEVFLEHM